MSFEPVSSAQVSSAPASSENVVRYAVKRTDGSVAHLSKEEIDTVSKESQWSSVKADVLAQYAFLKDMAIIAVAALIIVVLLIYAIQSSPARSYTIGASKPSFQSTVFRYHSKTAGDFRYWFDKSNSPTISEELSVAMESTRIAPAQTVAINSLEAIVQPATVAVLSGYFFLGRS